MVFHFPTSRYGPCFFPIASSDTLMSVSSTLLWRKFWAGVVISHLKLLIVRHLILGIWVILTDCNLSIYTPLILDFLFLLRYRGFGTIRFTRTAEKMACASSKWRNPFCIRHDRKIWSVWV